MIYRVEIRSKEGFGDPHAQMVFHQVRELGMDSVTSVRSARLFFLVGEFSQDDATRIADELLTDPVIEEYHVGSTGSPDDATLIEVHLKAGVMDPVAASAEKAVTDMGLQIEGIRTARRYELLGDVSDEQRQTVARKLLANPVIEEIHFEAHTPPEISTRQ